MFENDRGEVFTSEYGKFQKIDVPSDASLQEKAKQAVVQGSYALGANKNGYTLIRAYSPDRDPYKSWTYQHTPAPSAFYYGRVESDKSASTIGGVRALFPDVFGEFGQTEK